MLTPEEYEKKINEAAEHVFSVMQPTVSEADMLRLRDAFALAKEAHAPQVRKTGEPYILHPIAVATIAAEELKLDVNSVIAAFLHDVVEDTPHPIEEIAARFGDDVAHLVDVLTKKEKKNYDMTKQVDNFRQILDSVQTDLRPIMIKLSDRLHNMRTLSSMRPDKRMKIAGETDYFYAPFANRLGLYYVKTELENLSLKFRVPHEYARISSLIEEDKRQQSARLDRFKSQIALTLAEAGIEATVEIVYREPYSVWRKMKKYGDDFNHLKYRHFTDVVFKVPEGCDEKTEALRIYAVLTDRFREKPGGIANYIDSPKENGYQSFHVKLLADFGRWQEVHISSERMARNSKFGFRPDQDHQLTAMWIERFRRNLREIGSSSKGIDFLERVTSSFYNDDIMVFTHEGKPVILPQKSSCLDFAYELGKETGDHAKYARVNGFLSSVKSKLHRGDVVQVFTEPSITPSADWLDCVVTYKAKKHIREYLESLPKHEFESCPICHPIPGEEVVGFRKPDGTVSLHRRDCTKVLRLASQFGDDITDLQFLPDGRLYPVKVTIKAVDRPHLFLDLVDCISNKLKLNIDCYNSTVEDSIVTADIDLGVHSYEEVQKILLSIADIPDVDDVRYVTLNKHS